MIGRALFSLLVVGCSSSDGGVVTAGDAEDAHASDVASSQAEDTGLETGDAGACDVEENDVCVDQCLVCSPERVVSEWVDGAEALNCGVVAPSEDLLAVGECMANSFQESAPFYGLHAYPGDDSLLGTGWALGPDGVLRGLRYDSSPCGDLYCRSCTPRLTAFECSDPSLSNEPRASWTTPVFDCGASNEIVLPACVFER